MSAYIIVDIEVRDAQSYDRYKAAAPSSIAAFGGRYLARSGRTEVLEGEWTNSRRLNGPNSGSTPPSTVRQEQ
jgi:uncharacterized protein (DUF1330 family)